MWNIRPICLQRRLNGKLRLNHWPEIKDRRSRNYNTQRMQRYLDATQIIYLRFYLCFTSIWMISFQVCLIVRWVTTRRYQGKINKFYLHLMPNLRRYEYLYVFFTETGPDSVSLFDSLAIWHVVWLFSACKEMKWNWEGGTITRPQPVKV